MSRIQKYYRANCGKVRIRHPHTLDTLVGVSTSFCYTIESRNNFKFLAFFFQNLGFSGFSVDCLKFRCDTRGHFLILKKCSFRPLFTKAQEVHSRNTYDEELNDRKNNLRNLGYLFYT